MAQQKNRKEKIMNLEDVKKKKEELVKQHDALKEKIDEGKTAIANMQAQQNGLVGAVQLCNQFINDSEKQNSKKDK